MFPERAIVLDTESTGFSPASGDRMIEIAAIEIVHGTITGNTMYGVFWPQRSVPDRAAEVHGWTTAKLRGKPLFSTVAQQFADFFEGAELWAHNAPFDNRFLDAEMAKAGVRRSYALSCSMRLAKRQLPQLRSHKMADLATWAGHQWTGHAHTAMADTEALASVLLKLWPMGAPPERSAKAPKASTSKASPASTPTGAPKAPPIAAWTGSVAPANDPRISPITWTGPLFGQGSPWSPDEDARLRAAFLDGNGLLDLVQAHGRSPAALALRLERQGLIVPDHPYAGLRRR